MNRRIFNKKLALGIAAANVSSSHLLSNAPSVIKSKKNKYRMQKPKRLRPSDTIGLIAPSSPFSQEKYDRAIGNLKDLGFKVKEGKHLHQKRGYLAGTEKQRLEDLHNMFADEKVNGIWCIRGGYGATRLLPYIDFKLIKKNPKVLVGYSDITVLLHAMAHKSKLIGFHGPVGGAKFTPFALQHIKDVLMEPKAPLVLKHAASNVASTDEDYKVSVIRPGRVQGALVGGNLSLLSAMAGSKWSGDYKNKIVFIEDIGERPYRIDRMMVQMLQGTNLSEAAAIVLGIFADCKTKKDSLSLSDIWQDLLYDLGMPVIYGLSFGHFNDQFTLPVGVHAELDTQSQTITLLETAVL